MRYAKKAKSRQKRRSGSALNTALCYAGGMLLCTGLIAISTDRVARLAAEQLLLPVASTAAAKPVPSDVRASAASNAAIIAAAEARNKEHAGAMSIAAIEPVAGNSRLKKVLVKVTRN